MENIIINEIDEVIIDKYNILFLLGGGGFANVYLAEKKDNSNEKYAVKVLKKKDPKFDNKIILINIISILNSPYINKMLDNGECKIKIEGKEEKTQYIVYEYAQNWTLYDYIGEQFPLLEDKYIKIIFTKILKGLQVMHNNNICHRDIKLENILLGQKFIPLISDFGFSYYMGEKKGKEGKEKKLKDVVGTIGYMAPELLKIMEFNYINRNKELNEELEKERDKLRYNGKMADIFSLGITLLKLVTQTKYSNYKLYKYIFSKKVNIFLDKIAKIKHLKEAKKLIRNMINYYPQKRPTIDQILENRWLTDINENDLNLMNRFYNELNERKKEIDKKKRNERTIYIEQDENQNQNIRSDSNKSISFAEYNYFNEDFSLQFLDDTKINIRDYIQIYGPIEPKNYMNLIANQIKIELNKKDINKNDEREFYINGDNNYFKFEIISEYYENEEDKEIEEEEEEEDVFLSKSEEEEKEEEKEEKEKEKEEELKNSKQTIFNFKKFIKRKNLIIEVILFKSINGYHLLIFSKVSGEIDDYYDILEKIILIIKNSKKSKV